MGFQRAVLKHGAGAPRRDWDEPDVAIDAPAVAGQLAAFFPEAFGPADSGLSGGWLPRYIINLTDDAGVETTILVKPDGRSYCKSGGTPHGFGDWPIAADRQSPLNAVIDGLVRAAWRSRPPTRYHRQTILPQVGPGGERALAAARVLLVGCGALGTTIAEQLVRAGVGFLRIVDRDLVELSNLQRQVLFDETDAADGAPKAVAAARRLAAVNSAVTVEPVVADVHAGNVAELAGLTDAARAQERFVHLILDGTDNVETRYLLNDVSVRHDVPWVYGACVGGEGRVMAVRPGATPCLRCVFPEPPGPGELPTCDTAGVLGPAAAMVAALQAATAIQLLVGADVPNQLVRFDLWRGRFGATPLDDARRPDCPACGGRRFDFLDAPGGGAGGSTSLCGRNAVQVRPAVHTRLDLKALAGRLAAAGTVQQTPHLLKCALAGERDVSLTVFPDGRAIVHGTSDPARARSVYARWVGA